MIKKLNLLLLLIILGTIFRSEAMQQEMSTRRVPSTETTSEFEAEGDRLHRHAAELFEIFDIQPTNNHQESQASSSISGIYPAPVQQQLYERAGTSTCQRTPITRIRTRKFKRNKNLGTWCCLFGLMNSSLVLYFGIKNIVSKQGNTIAGLSEILLGTAGIAATAYTHKKVPAFLTKLVSKKS